MSEEITQITSALRVGEKGEKGGVSIYDEVMALKPPAFRDGDSTYQAGFSDATRRMMDSAKRHDSELAELHRVAGILKQACKTAIYQLKGREHDEFLRVAIAAAEAAGVK